MAYILLKQKFIRAVEDTVQMSMVNIKLDSIGPALILSWVNSMKLIKDWPNEINQG